MLHGCLDYADRECVRGWAQDAEHPERPVAVLITRNGELLDRVVANQHRPDLWAAGLGNGRYGFELWLPAGVLSAVSRHVVRVVSETDGSELQGSPVLIEAAGALDEAAKASITTLLDAVPAQDGIAFLAGLIARLEQRASAQDSCRAARDDRRFRVLTPAAAAASP